MPRCFALTVVTIVFSQAACLMTGAQAQDDGIKCDAFYKNSDGSWTAMQPVFLPGTKMVSRVGGVFRPGVSIDGYDVAAALDKACPNPATSPPAVVLPQQPYVSLSNAADANGAIDVTRLTCGNLADTSDEEASLLLAWYGYAPGGVTNGRIFNMARLRSAIHTVVDYCKTHRDQNLVKAMERTLR
jgi:HdeA/HdeB family